MIHFKMFQFLSFSQETAVTEVWVKMTTFQISNISFVQRAFLYSVRCLLMHPVKSREPLKKSLLQ